MSARLGLLFTLAAAAAAGALLLGRIASDVSMGTAVRSASADETEVRVRFNQSVVMLHAKQFEHALTAGDRVLALQPNMPEAHVNMGFAWLGLLRFADAEAAFSRAIDLRPQQANAYYGLALALEAQQDVGAAKSAMRTYLHLTKPADPYVRKARAALWEWEAVVAPPASEKP